MKSISPHGLFYEIMSHQAKILQINLFVNIMYVHMEVNVLTGCGSLRHMTEQNEAVHQ